MAAGVVAIALWRPAASLTPFIIAERPGEAKGRAQAHLPLLSGLVEPGTIIKTRNVFRIYLPIGERFTNLQPGAKVALLNRTGAKMAETATITPVLSERGQRYRRNILLISLALILVGSVGDIEAADFSPRAASIRDLCIVICILSNGSKRIRKLLLRDITTERHSGSYFGLIQLKAKV